MGTGPDVREAPFAAGVVVPFVSGDVEEWPFKVGCGCSFCSGPVRRKDLSKVKVDNG